MIVADSIRIILMYESRQHLLFTSYACSMNFGLYINKISASSEVGASCGRSLVNAISPIGVLLFFSLATSYRCSPSGCATRNAIKQSSRGRCQTSERGGRAAAAERRRLQSLAFRNVAFEPQFIMRADDPEHFEPIITRRYDHQVLVGGARTKTFESSAFAPWL